MTLHAFVTEVAVQSDPLPFPPFVFAIIAAAAFVGLAFVVWSFRDAANRQNPKTMTRPGQSSDHH